MKSVDQGSLHSHDSPALSIESVNHDGECALATDLPLMFLGTDYSTKPLSACPPSSQFA